MGLIRDAILSATVFIMGLGGGSAIGTGVQAPVSVVGSTYFITTESEPPYREVTPPPPPAEAPRDGLEAALARSAWPPHLWPQLVGIAHCESGLNQFAVGDHGMAWGLLQVRADVHPWLAYRHDLFTLDGNLAAAWEIYQDSGWRPWTCAQPLS